MLGVQDMSVPLGDLLKRLMSHSFNEIDKLLDQSSGDVTQKHALMNVLYRIYVLAVKYRATIKFLGVYKGASELVEYHENTRLYESYLDQFAAQLYFLCNDLAIRMSPLYDIHQTIDLIVGGGVPHLPLSMVRSRQWKSDEDPRKFFRMLNDSLKVRLLAMRLPENMKMRFSRGRAICVVPGLYKVFLSILDVDGPLTATKLELLRPHIFVTKSSTPEHGIYTSLMQMRSQGKDLGFQYPVSSRTITACLEKMNTILKQQKHPLTTMDSFIRCVLYTLEFQRLRIEAIRVQRAGMIPLGFVFNPTSIAVAVWNTRFFITLPKKLNGVLVLLDGGELRMHGHDKHFDEILGLVMRFLAVRDLTSFNEVLSRFGIGGQIDEKGQIPTLTYDDLKFYVPVTTGTIVCEGHPELTWGFVDRLRWPKIAQWLVARRDARRHMTHRK